MISYLPAFVTVGIVQSICRPEGGTVNPNPMAQIGVSHGKEGNRRTLRRPSVVNFMVFIRGNASADTQAPYPPRYAMNFLLVNATAVPESEERRVGKEC